MAIKSNKGNMKRVGYFEPAWVSYSEQIKINQSFVGKYSDVAKSILTKYLKIPNKKIGNIDETKGIHRGIIPRLSAIESLNWLLKRSVNSNNLANFVFFENSVGFNFVSLSSLYELNSLFTINAINK